MNVIPHIYNGEDKETERAHIIDENVDAGRTFAFISNDKSGENYLNTSSKGKIQPPPVHQIILQKHNTSRQISILNKLGKEDFVFFS